MTNQQKYKQLHKILDDAAVYARTIGKMDFDIQCCAPEEGLPQAGEDIAVLSQQYFKLTHSKKFERLVTELAAEHEGLTPVQQKVVEHLSDDWEKIKNIDAKLNYEMSLASSRAYAKWLEAKKESDFSIFRDAFAALIGYTQKTIDLRDEKKRPITTPVWTILKRAAASSSSTPSLARSRRASCRCWRASRRTASPSAPIS